MFDFIRTHQRLMLLVLVILIFPSFALVGISGYTNYVSGNKDLVKIGDASVTLEDFNAAQRNQMQQLQANMGAAFDPSLLDNSQARENLLESLIDRGVVIETATKAHFSVSDNVLRRAIAAIPELQVNGQFSPERYDEVLASMGISSRDFEQSQRAELALQRVLGPIGFTAGVPASVVTGLRQALTEQRTLRLKVYEANAYTDQVKVSDADVKDWYSKNEERLRVPEHVRAQYLVLDEAAAMKALPAPTDAEMQAYYDQNKSRYVLPGRVLLNHILIKASADASAQEREAARAKAQSLAEKVAADKSSFADVAKAESQDIGTAKDGGRLGWITRGILPTELETAIFALKQGDVSGVVEGPDGFHVFMASEVEPERGETFEQAKAKVEAEIRRQLGAERFAEMASSLRDLAYDNATTLEPAAQALGLDIRTATGIAQDRLLPEQQVQGQAAAAGPDATILEDARVRRALFSPALMAEKQNSGVIEITPDTLVVVRVDEVIPSSIQPLDQVDDVIREALVQEQALALARKAGEADLATYRAADGNAVPEGFGSSLTVSRVSPQNVNAQALEAAFRAPTDTLPAYTGVEGQGGYVVVRLEGVTPGNDGGQALANLPQEVNNLWGRAEERAVLKAMRTTLGVEVLPDAQAVIQGEAEQQ
ncbi:SurA N-terminal domain-containing protein [Pusillimonas minor]|uniref:Periplasmic chaperone PpiD n=1 Tax=Pusillimonas minor TaxID=2697024 RepID=A0A842HN77_9BURK|nr:SurA N-terminal domain-containing protein [Pusillimonas minor]MBC2769354.1 SurA N-terminal domain-containing protein [Pusillimonas minor]